MVVLVKDLKSLFGLICITIVFAILYGSFSGPFSTITAEEAQLEVMNNFRAVFVTTPNVEVAKKIAQ